MITFSKERRLVTAGRMRVSSTSKIKKITATKKNWIENGRRAEFMGSNPHSKGEGFSRSGDSFFASSRLAKIRAKETLTAAKRVNRI